MQDLKDPHSLPQPQNLHELELLKDYSQYIMEQVNELRLHPDHKEDLKEVLLQAMVQITLNLQKVNTPPKPQGFLFRLLNKTTR
jgi:hypothetical protein